MNKIDQQILASLSHNEIDYLLEGSQFFNTGEVYALKINLFDNDSIDVFSLKDDIYKYVITIDSDWLKIMQFYRKYKSIVRDRKLVELANG